MTQNTEQNVRTREEQIADLTNLFGEEGTFTFVDDRDAATKHILEAEARGAEEQRRKDMEETQHLWDHLATINNYGFQFDPEKDDPKKLADACIKAAREAIENPPANVATLESRIAELVEAEQLARADAEASKARVTVLEAHQFKDQEVIRWLAEALATVNPDLKSDCDLLIRAALTREGGV